MWKYFNKVKSNVNKFKSLYIKLYCILNNNNDKKKCWYDRGRFAWAFDKRADFSH